MTKDIGFVARDKVSGEYIRHFAKGITTEYLSEAKIYVSYSDWKHDITKSVNFEWTEFRVYPVKMDLMT